MCSSFRAQNATKLVFGPLKDLKTLPNTRNSTPLSIFVCWIAKKNYERISMKFCGGVGRSPGRKW